MDFKSIEEHYKRISDEELVWIATKDAKGLRPEVFGIIDNELRKRKLNPDILKGAFAQNKEYSIEEIEKYSTFLRELPCPICRNTQDKLNGTVSHTLKSFIIFSIYSSEMTIACPNCLDKKNNEAILLTALFGWWGIPLGLFKTPVYIYKNIKFKKENKLESSNNAMISFILGNIGEIETYKDDKERLKELIKPQNIR